MTQLERSDEKAGNLARSEWWPLGIAPIERAVSCAEPQESARAAGKALNRERQIPSAGRNRLRRALVNDKQHVIESRVAEPIDGTANRTSWIIGIYCLLLIAHGFLPNRRKRA